MYYINIALGAGCLHHIAIYNVNQIIYHSSKVFPESCPYLLLSSRTIGPGKTGYWEPNRNKKYGSAAEPSGPEKRGLGAQ